MSHLARHESPHLSFFPLLRDLRRKTYDSTLHGTVEKIITSSDSSELEKAQIAVENADKLYREIRIENTLTNENGEVNLKKGAAVEITIEACLSVRA